MKLTRREFSTGIVTVGITLAIGLKLIPDNSIPPEVMASLAAVLTYVLGTFNFLGNGEE